jgi:radical SAM protein with 4Fe4S-binding SPASM domain
MRKPKCLYAFRALTVGKSGSIAPCPSFKGSLGRIQELTDLRKTYETHPELAALRQAEDAGEWHKPSCEFCSYAPENSAKSAFNNYLEANYPALSKPELELSHLEIDFGNYCNLECVMCSSEYSTKWLKSDQEFNRLHQESSGIRRPEGKPWRLERSDVDRLLALCDTVTTIHVKGGEPLLEENFAYFLDGLIARQPHRYRLVLVTNFLLMNDRYAELLSKFNETIINISVDGVGKTYRWIRGVPFEQLEEKLHRYLPRIQNSYVVLNHTTNVYNVERLLEFYQWAAALSKGLGVKISIQFGPVVKFPEFLSPALTLRKKEVLDQIDELIMDPHGLAIFPAFKHSLHALKEYLEETQAKPIHREKLESWHRFLRERRGLHAPQPQLEPSNNRSL